MAGSGQWSDTTSLASDQLFQIGGPTTVRGYPTSGVAGHSGYTAAFELHRSLGDWVKGLDLYGFVDTGTVWATHPSRITLTSVGAGVTWDHDNRIVSDLSVDGKPMKLLRLSALKSTPDAAIEAASRAGVAGAHLVR